MANVQNLIPQAHKLTLEEQSAGGKASVKARKEKKLLREYIEELLQRDAGRDSQGKQVTAIEAMAIAAVKGAMNSDWKAWEIVRDTIGQKPVEKVMVSEVEQSVIDEVERMVMDE